MDKMSYADAKKVRGQSFSSLMTKRLVEDDQGIGQAVRNTLSEKTKATTTGIKETFDPMNIAKFMTGGSNLAPAIVGKLTGRKQEDIQHFAGKPRSTDTASKIGPLETSNEMVDMLLKIFELMKTTNEANIKHRERINAFAEEEKLEKDKRHKALIDAIRGKKGKEETATKIEQTAGMGIADVVLSILDAFGGAKTALTVLSRLGGFLVGPVGIALLGAASLGALFYAMSQASPEAQATANKVSGAMDASTEGAAIVNVVKDTTPIERRKQNILAQRPNNKKSMLFWKDPALQETYLKEVGWDDKTGLTADELKAGFVGLDEEGNPTKKNGTSASPVESTQPTAPTQLQGLSPGEEVVSTNNTGTTSASPAATGGGSPAGAPTATPSATTGSLSAIPTSSPNPSEKLNSVISENQIMKLEENVVSPTVITNSVNKVTSSSSTATVFMMPFVRNQEPTFKRMILNSTRVV